MPKMTGLDRLRELADDMAVQGLWGAILDGKEERWNVRYGDGMTVNGLLRAIADQIEADQEERVTRRAEDREAAEWVREHGGLEKVKAHWEGRVAVSHVEHMAERQRERRERMQRHIEYIQRLCRERRERIMELNKTVAEMRPRLMPEGMEWPRFDDGEPVRIGDAFSYGDETFYVDSIQLLRREFHLWATNGKVVTGSNGERCAHPAPKVLDADGVEIHVGDSVWDNRNWDALIVRSIGDEGNTVACRYVDVDDDAIPVHGMWMPSTLTHRAPVLAADGKPLREGETVWGTKGGSYNLTSVYDGKVFARHVGGSFGAEVESAGGEGLYRLRADQLTHERPDSWERLEEDIDDGPCVYFGRKACVDCPGNGRDGCEGQKAKARDLVRRAKALAGRDA